MKSDSEERNKQIENNFKDYIAYRGVDSNNETKNLDIELKNFEPNVENNNNNSEQNDNNKIYINNEYFNSKIYKESEEKAEIFDVFISEIIETREIVKVIDNIEKKQNSASKRTS